MIDALFGSKTRVKLLHLFLNNPGKAYYVREITRLIGEQINSVRRELANMLSVGIITSNTADNKLYYEVNQRYEYYVPLRAIFSDGDTAAMAQPLQKAGAHSWRDDVAELPGIRIALLSGVFVKGSTSAVDMLLVGDTTPAQCKRFIKKVESQEGREINYALVTYDDFYYRLSVRDKFITEIIRGKYITLVDRDNTLKATD